MERPHVCFESGLPIHGKPLTLYFHHVLDKKSYPEYRHCKWNIVLLHWDKHTNADNKVHCPKVEKYRKHLLKLHDAGKLEKVNPDTQFIDYD